MPVAVGSRLSQYELTALIGEGGMGRVFKGQDTRLGRSVAVKVLPDALSTDSERIARFEREAKMLASLNHPNIASLIGMDHADGVHFIVMELIDGETIADRLQHGAIPEKEALAIAMQIAEALEAAHERGVVHRDLKPANIKLTADGKVKVLDFGLAKAMSPETGSDADMKAANSPTLSMMATQAGLIMGTAAYMSPEQAKGSHVDSRSDIFSFGCVLFEMLTGQQPFQGETAPDILASVLAREPDFNQLPKQLDPRLREVLRRCLDKQRKRRWQAAGDLRLELEAIASGPVASPATVTVTPRSRASRVVPLAITAVAVAAITTGVMWMLRPVPPVQGVTRFPITLASDMRFSGFNRRAIALSPDGTRIAYIVGSGIYVRPMADFQADPVKAAITQTGNTPFDLTFSPDGRSVAYWQSDQIRRADLVGGGAFTVCKAENGGGIEWYGDSIYFAQAAGIMRAPVTGGEPEVVVPATAPEAFVQPQVLPGGRELLFTHADSTGTNPLDPRWDKARVVVQSLESKRRTVLLEGAANGRYVPTIDATHGHLLYVIAGVIFARPFDLARLAFTGPAVPVIEGVRRGTGTIGNGVAQFTTSDNGTLAYLPGPASSIDAAALRLTLFDRAGGTEALKAPAGPYATPRLSPNGRVVAFGVNDGRDISIWVYDMSGAASPRRLTFGGRDTNPAWTADSQRVIFQSDRDGELALYWQRADGAGTAERLTKPEAGVAYVPLSASPDGTALLVDRIEPGKVTLVVFSLKDRTLTPFGGVESTMTTTAVFSPDGKWVAYSVRPRRDGLSNVVFVQPYPATGAKYQVSSNAEDGHHQLWMAGGKELVFNPAPAASMGLVGITTTGGFSFSVLPSFTTLFMRNSPSSPRNYDVAADGKRILGLWSGETASSQPTDQVMVVVNWFQELRTRAPSR